MAGLEAASGGPITNIQQISPDFLFVQQLRRLLVILGQATDCLDIDLLRPGRQPGQLHVLDHTGAHRCHRPLLHVDDGTIPSRCRRYLHQRYSGDSPTPYGEAVPFNPKSRRSWRQLHPAVDPNSGEILALELTTTEKGDASLVGPPLDQSASPFTAVLTDGASQKRMEFAYTLISAPTFRQCGHK